MLWVALIVMAILFVGLLMLDIVDKFMSDRPYGWIPIALSVLLGLSTITLARVESLKNWSHRLELQREAEAHQQELEEAQVVEVYPVEHVGVDDLAKMYEFYKVGTDIVVCSGAFDWILDRDDLRALIVSLAREGKLLLVSYRRPEEIDEAWARHAAELGQTDTYEDTLSVLRPRYRFDEKKRAKKVQFTLIEVGEQSSFLSLVRGVPGIGKDCNIGIHSGKNNQAHALVMAITKLLDRESLQNLPGWNDPRARHKQNNVEA